MILPNNILFSHISPPRAKNAIENKGEGGVGVN